MGDFTNGPLVYGAPLAGVNTTRFLHRGDFVRLRNVQLGYTLPTEISQKFAVRQLRVYVTGQNLLTFTKFPGWDPEVVDVGNSTEQGNVAPGTVGYQLPQVRTVLVGINVNF